MTGANCGVATVILAVDGTVLTVRDLPRGEVESGCRVEIREGCDKRFQTCLERFANAANFRGARENSLQVAADQLAGLGAGTAIAEVRQIGDAAASRPATLTLTI